MNRGFAERSRPRYVPLSCVNRADAAAPQGSFSSELATKLPTISAEGQSSYCWPKAFRSASHSMTSRFTDNDDEQRVAPRGHEAPGALRGADGPSSSRNRLATVRPFPTTAAPICRASPRGMFSRRRSPAVDEPRLVRDDDCGDPITKAELREDAPDVRLDGRLTKDQSIGDLAVRESLGDQRQDLAARACSGDRADARLPVQAAVPRTDR